MSLSQMMLPTSPTSTFFALRIRCSQLTEPSQLGHTLSTALRSRLFVLTMAVSTPAASSLNSCRRKALNGTSPCTTPCSTMELQNLLTTDSLNMCGPFSTTLACPRHSGLKLSNSQSGSRTAPPLKLLATTLHLTKNSMVTNPTSLASLNGDNLSGYTLVLAPNWMHVELKHAGLDMMQTAHMLIASTG